MYFFLKNLRQKRLGENVCRSILLLLFLVLCLALFSSLLVGAVPIHWMDIISGQLEAQERAVLFSIRMPRALLGALVGAGLSVSGAALQGLFRNPLADPGLIGITGGAAMAAAFVIVVLGSLSGFLGLYALSLSAFVGGLVASLVVFQLARGGRGGLLVTNMLLAGIAINAIAGAGTGLLSFLGNDQQLRTFVFWTMGGLGGALWSQVIVCASLVLPLTYFISREGRLLNILMLGEEQAGLLGISTDKLKRRILFFTALNIGICVAVSGVIGFVGLVVPHLIRLTLGPDHRVLIPASALLGAILLSSADIFSRTLIAPAEFPVGLITSLIGGPFFIWLLIRKKFEG